jgi:hypothetical protein
MPPIWSAEARIFGDSALGRLEVPAQVEARALDVSVLDRLIVAPMLELNLLQIEPTLLRGLRFWTYGLAGDDDRSEEEPFEIGIAGRR